MTGQIFVALALGVLSGAVFPARGQSVKPVGEGFLRLISIVVVPLVFASLAVGVDLADQLNAIQGDDEQPFQRTTHPLTQNS